MKVVLFCGGQGMRLREHSDKIPKPMVKIGYRPILWHIMKYYAHFGHTEFILCLGYKADYIKEYFLNYNEAVSNDFIFSKSGKSVEMLSTDISQWKISLVDTGYSSNIGERLVAIKDYLGNDDVFLANYSDNLTNFPLNKLETKFYQNDNNIAGMLCVKPRSFYHFATIEGSRVNKIHDIENSNLYVNGGYFIFKKEIFNYIKKGEELIHEPFNRLINEKKLLGYKYNGFWQSMDTFKDKQLFDKLYEENNPPWIIKSINND